MVRGRHLPGLRPSSSSFPSLTRRRRDDLVAQAAKEFDTLEELHTPDRTLPEVHLQIAETGRLLEEVKQKLNTALGG